MGAVCALLLTRGAQTHLATMSAHVLEGCAACAAKGAVCELCRAPTPLYAFQTDVERCELCRALLHRRCWSPTERDCPRCVRLQDAGQG